jgi:hypothetical protein
MDSINDIMARAQAHEQEDLKGAQDIVADADERRKQEEYQSNIDAGKLSTVGNAQATQAQQTVDYSAANRKQLVQELGHNTLDTFKASWNGVANAAGEFLIFADGALSKALPVLNRLGSHEDLATDVRAKVDAATFDRKGDKGSVAGDLTQGLTQFAVGMIPMVRGARLIGLTGKVGTVLATAGTQATFFNPDDPRLSNLIESFPSLKNPVTEFLASKPDDSEAEGRFKNFLEGSLVGVPLEAAQAAAGPFTSWLKGARAAKQFAEVSKAADEVKPTPAAPPEPPLAANDATASVTPHDREGFLKAYEALPDHKTQIGTKKVGSASVSLSSDPFADDTVHLETIRADETGKGHGPAALKQITELADQHGVKVTLDAIPMDGDKGISAEKLSDFYKSHGFTSTEGGLVEGRAMVREPVAPKPWEPPAFQGKVPGEMVDQPKPGEVQPRVFNPSAVAANAMAVPKEQAAEVLKAIQEGRFNDAPAMLDDTHRTFPWAQMSDGANLKGVLNAVEDNIGKLIKANHGVTTVSDKTVAQLAKDIGGDVGSLQRLYGQVTGEGGLAARITAGYNMLQASARELKALAMDIRDLDLKSETGAKAVVAFQKQLSLHSAIQGEVRASSAEIGRALRAHRELKGSSDVALKYAMDYGNTALGPKALKKLAAQVANAEDLGQLSKVADQNLGKGLFNIVREIANNGMLSGVVTQGVNVIGNTMKTMATVAERYVAAGIGNVRGVFFPSAETASFREAVAHTQGAYQGFKQAFGLAWQSLKDESFVSKYSQPIKPAIVRSTDGRVGLDLTFSQIINAVGKVVRFPGRLMGLSDHFTQAIGYNADLNARAYVQAAKEADVAGIKPEDRGAFVSKRMDEITKSPTTELDEKAMAAGRYSAYLEPAQTFLGDMTQNAFNNHPMAKLIIAPFTHRPGNILRQSVGDYTIAGLAQKEIRAQLAAGGTTADIAMARMFMGTGALVAGWQMAENGQIVGQRYGSANTAELSGVPKYSVKIGDTWHKFDRMDPVGMWLGLSADLTEAYHHRYDPNDPDANEALSMASGAAVMALSRNMMEKSFMKSLDDLMAAMSEKEPVKATELGKKLVAENVAKLLPFSGLLRTAERATDHVSRSSGRDSLFDGVVAAVPYLAQDLPSRKDLLGRELPPTSWWNPFNSTQGNTDKMSTELANLAIGVTPPSRTIDGYQLNAHEYDQLVKTATTQPIFNGLTLEQYLRETVNDPSWEANKKAPDGGQFRNGTLVQSAIDAAYNFAKQSFRADNPQYAMKKQQEQVNKFMASMAE